MKIKIAFFLSVLLTGSVMFARQYDPGIQFFGADHPYIQYTGRIDVTNPKLPRFWQPGVYFSFRFKGSSCEIILNDEILWGSKHNYIELVVDGKARRLQTKSKTDTIRISEGLSAGIHTVVLCKNTEANIGFLELAGIRCQKLLKPLPGPKRKMECIGNSITCGASSDISAMPCGKGLWEDQHNAYMSYASVTARNLDAQYHLSSVSGIGLMHSCCNLEIIMPQVYDKVSMRNDAIVWDFKKYQPDLVTVCLGQNDGIQDSAAFCDNYISFIKRLRKYHPKATLVLLSSPMADDKLKIFMQKTISSVVDSFRSSGEKKIYSYIFSRQYIGGCDYHPSLPEHKLIADELTAYVKKIMNW